MDHFMKLSVLSERVKTQDKGQRTIGSNKGAPNQGAAPQEGSKAKT